MVSAFYEPVGPEQWRATVHTRGPWSLDHQHGGPPTALLARAAEVACPDLAIARVTVELLRPVPIGLVRASVSVERMGRSVASLTGVLWAGDTVVLTARFLMVAPWPVDAPQTVGGEVVGAGEPFTFPFFRWEEGYHRAVEVRRVEGVFGEGDMTAWMRPTIPLVAGEQTSPVQALCVVVDAGSGVGAVLDTRRFTFLNADLSVHLLRAPQPAGVCLRARTWVGPAGRALCVSSLADLHGPIGEACQTLVVRQR